jgi:hypothetical protein
MILDLQTTFSGTVAADGTKTAQAVTATAISTNVLDLRNASTPTLVDEGLFGKDLWLVVQTIQVFATLTSLTITLESAADAGLTSGPVVHFSTGAILLAALTANTVLARVQLPSADYKRYVGLRYTVGGSSATTGSILAYLTPDVDRNKVYPSGFTIDV